MRPSSQRLTARKARAGVGSTGDGARSCAHCYAFPSCCCSARPRRSYIPLTQPQHRSGEGRLLRAFQQDGAAPKVSGGLTLDPARPDRIDLDVVLEASALTAPDTVTLGRFTGPQFFDSTRYPTVRFDDSTMRMTSDPGAVVAGAMTARGVTRPATLSVRFASPRCAPRGVRRWPSPPRPRSTAGISE